MRDQGGRTFSATAIDRLADSSNSTSPVSAFSRTCSANGIIRAVDDSPASRGSSSAAIAARSVSSCTRRMPSRSFEAMTSFSISPTASNTLASEGRRSALVISGGSCGALPPRSAGPTDNRMPMTDAIDSSVVYRDARPCTTLRSWPSGIPVRMAKGLSPSASIR